MRCNEREREREREGGREREKKKQKRGRAIPIFVLRRVNFFFSFLFFLLQPFLTRTVKYTNCKFALTM